MKSNTMDRLYGELRKFQVPSNCKGDGRYNQFWKITEKELLEVEKKITFSIPDQLRTFYLEVGHGHFVVDQNGVFQDDYFNIFVDLQRLKSLWDRTEVSYQYDSEIVDKGEMPFFDTGSFNYMVLRPHSSNPNAVFNPYDKKPLAKNFNEFIQKLYENTTFYLDHEGVYEE